MPRITTFTTTLALTAAAAVTMLLGGTTAHAALLAEETFDYATGTLEGQNGGTGWGGAWGKFGSGDLPGDVSSPGLTHPSTIDTGTNKASIDATSSDHARPVRDFASGIAADGLWLSFIGEMNTEDRRAAGFSIFDGSGNVFVTIGRPNNSDAKNDNPGNWAIGNSLSSLSTMNEATDGSGGKLKASEKALVVANLNLSGAIWTLDMFLNPNSSGTGSASHTATFTHSNGAAGDLRSIEFFVGDSGAGNLGGPSAFDFDEFRVGESFSDVTPIPEPASVALLGLGGMMLLSRRRRA